MHLNEKVKQLPLSPGVYLMKDSLGNTIYVGKAKKLKVRIQSYFRESKHHSPKVKKLVKNIDNFEVIHTDTEFEAFLLEYQLIKQIKPFFNSRLKKPQTYPYIVVIKKNGIREIKITNQPYQTSDSSPLIFGPYTSKSTVEIALNVIKDTYKINCRNLGKRNSACLNYSLGTCLGICLGGKAIEQYERILDKIIGLLKGNDLTIVKEMKQNMELAAEDFDFETATKYRDSITAIQHLIRSKKVVTFIKSTKNIVVLEPLVDHTYKFFFIKGNQVLYKEKFALESLGLEQVKSRVLKHILTYFKELRKESAHKLEQAELDEAQIIYSYLKGSNCHHLFIPRLWLNTDQIDKLVTALDNWLIQVDINVKE